MEFQTLFVGGITGTLGGIAGYHFAPKSDLFFSTAWCALVGLIVGWQITFLVNQFGIIFFALPAASSGLIGLYAGRTYAKAALVAVIGRIKSIKAHKPQLTIEELDAMLKEYKEIQESKF